MSATRTIKNEPLRGLGVDLLRAVHLWTGRAYRRALVRRELRRIGRQVVAERRAGEQGEKLKAEKLKAETKGVGPGQSEGRKCQAI